MDENKLSQKDRLILVNQFKILEKLYPEEAEYYLEKREILEQGYELLYTDVFGELYERFSEEECREVLDILDLYRVITFSYRDLEDKSEIEEYKVRFAGFDGNNECKQLAFAEFFIKKLNRFQELFYGEPNRSFNSHCPTMYKYKPMLEKWYKMERAFELSKKQLIEILDTKAKNG